MKNDSSSDTPSDRWQQIAAYIAEGLAKNELCIMILPDQEADVVARLESNGVTATDAVDNDDLQIYDMYSTYSPDGGRFAATYMLYNLDGFIEDAKRQGYSGLRTVGEMSWLFEHTEKIPAAISYEQQSRVLRMCGKDFTGMCLSRAEQTFSETLTGVFDASADDRIAKQGHRRPSLGS